MIGAPPTLRELLGLEVPIIQAPMAGAQDSKMAIAVSNAGGLGSLPCAMLPPEKIRTEMEAIRAEVSRPYNVNFFCHTEPASDAVREAAWREALTPYYQEFGLEMADIKEGAKRAPFSPAAADVLEPFKPPVVSFHFGLPSPDLLAGVRSWNAKILASATTVAEALWLEERGVDIIIAQGLEAGGHRGHFLSEDLSSQVGTIALLPQIMEAVNVPVVAAGGIADARGVAAVMAMGAAGVQIGTAYLLCPESTIGAAYRTALKSEAARHTALTNVFSGRPARGIINRLMREQGPLSSLAPSFPLAATAVAPLRAKAESWGSGDFSPLWAGQNVNGCKEVPAGELTRQLAAKL